MSVFDDEDTFGINDGQIINDPARGISPTDPLAGYSAAEQDFLRRNQNADGSYDIARMSSALTNDTSDRVADSQDPRYYDTHGNYIGPSINSGGGVSTGGGNGGGGNSGYSGGPAVPTRGPAPTPIRPFEGTFTAPTLEEATNAPGFQFELGEALQAIRRGGLANGTFFTNRTASALEDRAKQMSQSAYGDLYARKFNEYGDEESKWYQNEQNRFDSERANRGDDFSMDSGIYGMARSNRLDDFSIADTNRKFDFGVLDSNRNFDRTLSNDQWSHGADLWSMNRTDNQDQFSNNLSVEELRRKYQPRPA